MAESTLLQIFELDGVTNVEFTESNILDEVSINKIGSELGEVIERKGLPRVVLNFDNVGAMSSSALGMLITVNTKIGDKKGKLALACIKGPIADVFRITKLDKAFDIYETVGGAVSAVR